MSIPTLRLLQDTLRHSVVLSPGKTALITGQERLSYAALWERSLRLAHALRLNGVQRGDRVGIFLDNTWQCAVSLYGTLLADAVFVIINPQTKADKLAYILNDCTAKVLIADGHLHRSFLPAIDRTALLSVIFIAGKTPDALDSRCMAFDDVLAAGEYGDIQARNINLDLCSLIYTSGSTGEPKGVMHTHQSMLFALLSLVEYLRLHDRDCLLCALPLAFDYGLYQLLMAVHLGATLVLERSFAYPAQIFKVMVAEGVTVFPGVPTSFALLLAAHERQPLCFASVTRVTNTAAALPSSFNTRLKEIFPNADIYRMYGLTECKRVSYLDPALIAEKPESVGKAIPGTETLVLNEAGEPVQPGEPGILHVRGAHVMAGYWNQPEKTARMLKAGLSPGERMLCTHDYFTVDEDGCLYFLGRSDDIIKSRGEKISPLEVERVLYGLASVHEAAVIGVPDPILGQAVFAFVSIKEGHTLAEVQLKKWCCDHLENFMLPKQIIILPALPHSANGKIDKKRLATFLESDDAAG